MQMRVTFQQTACLAVICSVSRPSEPQRNALGAMRPRVVRATCQEVLAGEDVKGRRARGQANDVTGDANRILGQLDTLQGTLDTISRDLPGAPRGARPGRPRSLAPAAFAAEHAGERLFKSAGALGMPAVIWGTFRLWPRRVRRVPSGATYSLDHTAAWSEQCQRRGQG